MLSTVTILACEPISILIGKIIKNPFLVGRCLRNVSPAPPVDFCDFGDTDIVQIVKLVMQIHANCVLIIDELKIKIF